MSYFSEIFSQLSKAIYCRLHFNLEFTQSFILPQGALLQLRREFTAAMKLLKEQGRVDVYDRLQKLLAPPLPSSQLLRRQVKSPPPGLVVSFDPACSGSYRQADVLTLTVVLVGKNTQFVNDLVLLLNRLGHLGIFCGTGQYRVCGVCAENGNGDLFPLPYCDFEPKLKDVPLCDLRWWLDRAMDRSDCLQVEFLTPLRLVKKGKPVFKPDTSAVLASLARRVATMIAYHCQGDVDFGHDEFSYLNRDLKTIENSLKWCDWRELHGDYSRQKIGGVLGRLTVGGEGFDDVCSLFRIGQLFNLGKGAAFGSGQYRLLFPNN